jgi:hypothetical protein
MQTPVVGAVWTAKGGDFWSALSGYFDGAGIIWRADARTFGCLADGWGYILLIPAPIPTPDGIETQL